MCAERAWSENRKPRGLTSSDTMVDKVGTLIVDSGALIRGAPIQEWSSNVVTVKDILAEVKDVNTRRRLQVLPFEITFKEPSREALYHVTSFAKKTGDYSSLSKVDLRLLALTYQLECEQGTQWGTNLRTHPCIMEPLSTSSKTPTIVGFYSRSKKGSKESEEAKNETASNDQSRKEIACVPVEDLDRLRIEQTHQRESMQKTSSNCVHANTEYSDPVAELRGCLEWNDGLVGDDLEQNENLADDDLGPIENLVGDDLKQNKNSIDEGLEQSEDLVVDNLEQSEDCSEESDDEDSWITPSNFQLACEKMGGALETHLKDIAVGCITTDYAMQNVLLQMGLNVISIDGMRIKQLHTYAMKCKACFKVSSDTGLRFCPHCGNRTLIKVAMVLSGEQGTVQYRALSQKQFSHKGLRYSLPLPKGGRHANNPIVAPDQRETSKQRRTRGPKLDALHPDYIAQSSPFAMKDVTSRGAQVRFAHGRGSGGRNGWRNNPNAAKPKGRRK